MFFRRSEGRGLGKCHNLLSPHAAIWFVGHLFWSWDGAHAFHLSFLLSGVVLRSPLLLGSPFPVHFIPPCFGFCFTELPGNKGKNKQTQELPTFNEILELCLADSSQDSMAWMGFLSRWHLTFYGCFQPSVKISVIGTKLTCGATTASSSLRLSVPFSWVAAQPPIWDPFFTYVIMTCWVPSSLSILPVSPSGKGIQNKAA